MQEWFLEHRALAYQHSADDTKDTDEIRAVHTLTARREIAGPTERYDTSSKRPVKCGR